MKKSVSIYSLVLLGLISFLMSCTRIDFGPCSPEEVEPPVKDGSVTLVTVWNDRSPDASIPSPYFVDLGNQELRYTELSNLLPYKKPGTYPVMVYNKVDKIILDANEVATVPVINGFIDTDLDYWFTGKGYVTYVDGEHRTEEVHMIQQVREISLDLLLEGGDIDDILSIDAVVDGLAHELDLNTNEHIGSSAKANPTFQKDGNKFTADMMVLGIDTSKNQTITLTVKFKDGTTQQLVADVTSELVGFNDEKSKKITLESMGFEVKYETKFEARIVGWTSGGTGSGTAD